MGIYNCGQSCQDSHEDHTPTPDLDMFLRNSNLLYYHIIKCPWCKQQSPCDTGKSMFDRVEHFLSKLKHPNKERGQ